LKQETVSGILYIFLLHCHKNQAVFYCCVLHAKYACSSSDIMKKTTNVHKCLQVTYIIL